MSYFPATDIYAITDARQSLQRSTIEVVKELLNANVRIIQYREKNLPAGKMLEECLLIRSLTREAGCCFVVNDHVAIAMACEADGIHVGQDDLPIEVVRKLVGNTVIIGMSASSLAQAKAAQTAGADYVGIGAIYSTATKKDASYAGIKVLTKAVQALSIPCVAIGGITEETLPEVLESGVQCVCMVSNLTLAPDIPKKVEILRDIYKKHR